MNRITLLRDDTGERIIQPEEYPLRVGGDECHIALPGEDLVAARIGEDQGHPFIQPEENGPEVWHNHERLAESAWLKSGDQVQIGNNLVLWQVQGDQIVVTLGRAGEIPIIPPSDPPPVSPPAPRAGHPPMVSSNVARRGRWIIGSLFAVLLLAAAFVMLATPVTVQVEPDPEKVSLLGMLPAISLPGRILALPGDYTLTAERAGYRVLREQIQISYGKGHLVQYKLVKLPGLVSVRSTPEGALLKVDGEASGETPVDRLEIAPGQHTLRLEADRFQPLERMLDVTGMGQLQELDLEMKPDWAAVTLATEPPGAEIRQQQKLLAMTPAILELQEGEYHLQISLKGYKPHAEQVVVQADVAMDLPLVRLIPADGMLRLSTIPSGSMVSLNGEFRGITPLELPLSPSEVHTIKLTKAGYRPLQRTMTLAPEEQEEMEIKMQPEYGVVFISSQPADAKLSVDGQPRGQATTRLKLPARAHRIEISKPGFVTYSTTITPVAGGSRNLDVVLKSSDAKKSRARPPQKAERNRSDMVRIAPSGQFTLGASRREPGRRANENLRTVELTRPYEIGRREVSNAEFRRFRPAHDSGLANGASLNRDDQPVVNVSWDDAAGYLNWLSRREGLPPAYRKEADKMVLIRPVTRGYRLPSEVEWAYAARFSNASQTRKFPWPGDRPVPPRVWGNYADTSARAQLSLVMEGYTDGYPVTAPVASFAPDESGLYDLDGNVAEWVQDYYAIYPGGVGKISRDPLGPASGRHHVVRGSSWRDASLTELRLSYRDYSEKARNDLGFRVARYAD